MLKQLLHRILNNPACRSGLFGKRGRAYTLLNPVPLASAPDLLIDYVTSAAISENGHSTLIFLKIDHNRGVEL